MKCQKCNKNKEWKTQISMIVMATNFETTHLMKSILCTQLPSCWVGRGSMSICDPIIATSVYLKSFCEDKRRNPPHQNSQNHK